MAKLSDKLLITRDLYCTILAALEGFYALLSKSASFILDEREREREKFNIRFRSSI